MLFTQCALVDADAMSAFVTHSVVTVLINSRFGSDFGHLWKCVALDENLFMALSTDVPLYES
jgi:hypothetical protein